ncbi:hypothetical protein IAU59_007394 [Kwoniella sp. CBS 9459]
MNITIDDTSPQFLYYSAGGTWLQNHTDDDQTSKYFKETFMATKTDGDSVSFTFNGTAIYIYGAKRANHGVYSIQLDGGSVSYQKGYDGTVQIQAVIYSATGLSADQEHTVVLTNLPSQSNPPPTGNIEYWFDVDYAIITSPMSGKIYTTTLDDTSSAFEYVGSAWTRAAPSKDLYNTTGHYTANPGDSLQMSFNGSSVQIFGSVAYNHGNYSISLDGREPSIHNGTFYTFKPSAALYTASGLEDGPHTLTMTNIGLPDLSKLYLGFDWAVVNSSVDPTTVNSGTTGTNITGSTNGLPTNPVTPEADGGSTNIPAIAGGVAGGVVGLALVAILAWFLHKRSKRNKEDLAYVMRSKGPMDLDGGEVKPYEHGTNAYHQPLPSSSSSDVGFPQNGIGQDLIPAAREIDHSRTPFLTAVPAPPPSNATSYPRSVNPPSSVGSPPSLAQRSNSSHLNPFGITAASTATFGHGHGSSPQGSSAGDDDSIVTPSPGGGGATTTRPAKSAGVALPFTARPPVLPPISSGSDSGHDMSELAPPPQPQPAFGRERNSSFGSQRMYVPGREQDMGPVPLPPARSGQGDGNEEDEEQEDQYGTLPPDYHQATQPLPGQQRS